MYLLIKIFNENKNKIKYEKLFIILFIISFKINNESKKYYYPFNVNAKKNKIELINSNLTKHYYKIKGLEFLNKIKKKKLNNITKQIKFKEPLISVIIPIYNCEKTIQLSIKSISFQDIKELEIIIINDFSKDNSTQKIEELKNYDQRIRIINNKRNMGTLYSRSIGALNAKGRYIIGLDNDDLFLSEDTLRILYLNALKNDFDIIEIKSLEIPNYSPRYKQIKDGHFIFHPNNLILQQPELGIFSISQKNELAFNDHYAWGKLVKLKIYQKALNKLGYKEYSEFNCWTEDMSIVFVLFNTANSFIFLNIFGIFHLISKTTTTRKLTKNHKLLSGILFLRIVFDHSKNDTFNKNLVAEFSLSFSAKNINKLDSKYMLYFKTVVKKLIGCKFVHNQFKYKLNKKFHDYLTNDFSNVNNKL